MTPMWTVLDTMWWFDVVVVASPNCPSSRHAYEVVVWIVGAMTA